MAKKRIQVPVSQNNDGGDVTDIVLRMPHWIVRYGISIVFAVFGIFIFLSWMIKYPDVLPARAKLITSPPPIRVVCENGGRLARIFKENGDSVKSGEVLMALETAADLERITALEMRLAAFSFQLESDPEAASQSNWETESGMGALQAPYLDFLTAIDQLKYLTDKGPLKTLQAVKADQQLAQLDSAYAKLLNRQQLMRRELELTENEFRLNQEIYRKKMILIDELNRSEIAFLQKKSAMLNLESSLAENRIQVKNLKNSQLESRFTDQNEGQQLLDGLRKQTKLFTSRITEWKRRNLVLAPISGTVSFFESLSEQQLLTPGLQVAAIIPSSSQMVGMVEIAELGAGQLKLGQTANIRLDNYDYRKYGVIEGKVAAISDVPREGVYFVELEIPNGLRTNYGIRLEEKPELNGQAEIITEDQRLLIRLLNNFLQI